MTLAKPLFAVPFSLTRHPGPGGLNRALCELFRARAAEGDRYAHDTRRVDRNDHLFESRFDLFAWPDDCVQALRKFCLAQLYRMIGEVNGYTHADLQRLHVAESSWFHVTRRGGYFGLHNHPMATWSGVYCVSAGGAVPDNPDSGALVFVNPHATSQMFKDGSTLNLHRPYSTASQRFQLEPGELLLFPSWLLHEVRPFHGDGERITVAFNAWFKMA
ncbi:MAG TPA: putative 2OG-Fe(II) oxygenase [Xanthomonadaceae bacterium]|nr:putative 2OG-Fe(II) oxygenase [Xanthomonadaceae bacterium]